MTNRFVLSELNEEIKTLQDTNRALQLYMNKILMKIINNKQLEDVLSIDQPSKSTNQQPATNQPSKTSAAASGPAPTKTVSTATTAKSTSVNNRQRRRTISYWGAKAPPPPPSKSSSQQNIDTLHATTAATEDRRRHSSIVQKSPQPERSVSTTTTSSSSATNGGWAKALRRMSGIGWSSAVKEEPAAGNGVNNDSAVGSLSEEETEKMSLDASRKSSGSSTPSIRRSNELGTLNEE